jgi:hypothetical protein
MDLSRNRVAGHAAGRFDHLKYAEALTVAEVEDQPVVASERVESQQVSVRKV